MAARQKLDTKIPHPFSRIDEWERACRHPIRRERGNDMAHAAVKKSVVTLFAVLAMLLGGIMPASAAAETATAADWALLYESPTLRKAVGNGEITIQSRAFYRDMGWPTCMEYRYQIEVHSTVQAFDGTRWDRGKFEIIRPSGGNWTGDYFNLDGERSWAVDVSGGGVYYVFLESVRNWPNGSSFAGPVAMPIGNC
ncbi:hypothetical protein [Streptomyces shenzhenensis]|uniref:hypothetical protein n=1 Tax=Streptomyces shenzhenensis TaxID=943815 RepID=UPI0033C3B398